MKNKYLSYAFIALLLLSGCSKEKPDLAQADIVSESGFTSFVTVQGDELVDENGSLRFISYNIPCLHYNEDYMPFDEMVEWRFPDEFEIRDALETIRVMGGQVARTYTLSVRQADDDPAVPRHVDGPGQFNEEAFVALDKVLQIANEKNIRLIIPFVNGRTWWGGVAEYAGFRGKKTEAFWTDPEIFEDFKKTIAFVINRKNTFTGVYYKDDPAILGWQTGNELDSPHQWTVKAAAYIKSLDKNHLVIDGFYTDMLREESINAPEIDVVNTHHYSNNADKTIRQIKKSKAMAKGKKPYFVGEFGFLPTQDLERIIDTVIETETSGAMIWSLRKRNSEGGFYWHSEPLGGDLYKAYHWPGFDSGKRYDEKNVLKLMRTKAFEIAKKSPPKLKAPVPPVLLDISDVSAISWQGSVGAESYIILRSEQSNKGPWKIIETGVDEVWVQYRPLYSDTSAQPGKIYYYRIIAENSAGKSDPSNIVGPVLVSHKTLVDEMIDLKQIHQHKGELTLEFKQARKFKEDNHRLKGKKNAYVIYKLPKPIGQWKVSTFFENKVSDLKFSLSQDGKKYHDAKVSSHAYFRGQDCYGYYKPIEYKGQTRDQTAHYLKITFTDTAYLSNVEIIYDQQEHTQASSAIGFIKGFTWGWTGWRGQYEGPGPKESMRKLAETNSNWVCLTFGTEMETFDTPKIPFSQTNPGMITDEELLRAIQLARDNNLKIILKPVVNVKDGTWRSWIKFNNKNGKKDMQAWQQWWNDFEAFLLYYAKIAEETGCEMLCLGCEMGSTEEFEDNWRALITKIRKIYKGVLTYDANHGREDMITWWDAIDVISLSAYYPVGTDDVNLALKDDLSKVPPSDSSVKDMKKRWLPIKKRLAAISSKYKRPILFIELGVCSAKGYSAAPWTHHNPEAIYDGDEQRRFFQATIETFWDEPWFIGFTWWGWLPHLYTLEEAKSDTDFSVYGKPAEKLVTEWYSKPRK
jgi:mannan endo-1,4-beta-mannosidase